jgi:hypothetical protein
MAGAMFAKLLVLCDSVRSPAAWMPDSTASPFPWMDTDARRLRRVDELNWPFQIRLAATGVE